MSNPYLSEEWDEESQEVTYTMEASADMLQALNAYKELEDHLAECGPGCDFEYACKEGEELRAVYE